MTYFSTLSADEVGRHFRLIQEVIGVRRHVDLLTWLQGEVQRSLPHDILLSAWGDFGTGVIGHDIISRMPGVRTGDASREAITPLARRLFKSWSESGREPCVLSGQDRELQYALRTAGGALGAALQDTRSVLVHGMVDERGRHDCLYAMFSARATHGDGACGALQILLPYLDAALRQVEHLPEQHLHAGVVDAAQAGEDKGGLSDREAEIMTWVKKGKTNQEIGALLDISVFTVKNHLQRIFSKLSVSNRLQAVARIGSMNRDE